MTGPSNGSVSYTSKNSRRIDGLHLIETFKREVIYDKPSFIGTSIMDLSKLHMMRFHYEVIHKNFEGRYNLIYTDTDSLVYAINHHDIYNWISQHREHFDLSDSKRPELQDDTNKKVSGCFKCETNSLVIKGFIALSPKSYAYSYQTVEETTETSKTLNGFSRVTIKKEIKLEDFLETLRTSRSVKKDVVSIRSMNHQLYIH